MEDRCRKPQTAAGSEPKSRKTKKRLPPAKKTLVSKSDLGRPLPKASNSSRIRAQVPQNRNRKNCRNVAYKTHSKEKDKKRLPPAKKTLVSKSDLGRPLPKASNSSRIRAQVTQNRKPQKLPQRRIQNPLKRKRQEKIASSEENLSLEIWPWKTASESLKQQQDSSPSHAKPQPQKLPKRRLQNPLKRKRQVSKSDLGRPLPKASNSSRIRAQVPQNRNRKKCRNVAYKTHSKEKDKKRLPPAKKTLVSKSDLGRPLPKASNSNRIRAQVTQNRNHKNCRNVAYKTHSKERDKKRLPPAKKTLVSKSDLGRPLPKASNSSRIRAQVTQNQEKIASSKENLSLEIWPWKTASESLKQQQDSSPSPAKPQPQNRNRKNCRNVAYKTHSKEKDKKRLPPAKKTLVSKSDLGRPLPKASNSSRIRAQVTQNRKPQKLPKRRIQNPLKRKRQEKIASSKENLSLEIWPWQTASESLKQQQDSSPSHAKPQPQKLPKRRLQNPLKRKRQVSKSDLGRPLPKASNSSRFRAQVPQNRNRQKCRNVAYKTHSKEKDKKRLPPAKKTLVSKSDLGRPLPKASNSSRIRAQVTQNRNHKNCRNVAYKTHSKERDKKRLPPAKKTLVSKSDLGRPLVTSPLEAIKNNALPMRKGCAAAGQNAVRQNVTQNAVRQNAFRYLRSRLQHQQASKLWISSRILCNNFLGALPLTPKEGSADTALSIFFAIRKRRRALDSSDCCVMMCYIWYFPQCPAVSMTEWL